MSSIKEIRDCYGCGVCAVACPKQIIKMYINSDGFWEPKIINADICTNCGICLRCCSFSNDDLSLDAKNFSAYASWSKDDAVRTACSSGGAAYEISKVLVSQGYYVCAVRYNIFEHRAEHYIAETVEQLLESVGSKYIPSYTYDAFSKINLNNKNLIIGTPCQIDSFRRFAKMRNKEDNIVLIDFFCHGVPSMNVWKRYLKEVRNSIGTIQYVSWRDKANGWGDSWSMTMDSKTFEGSVSEIREKRRQCSYKSMHSHGNPFFYMFLSNSCLNKACYKNCKFKYNNSAADIRIGDLWGQTYKNDEKGVSSIIIFTDKGEEVLKEVQCFLYKLDFSIAAEGQMLNSPQIPITYYLLKFLMKIPFLSLKMMRRIMIKVEGVKYLVCKIFKENDE